MNLKKTGLLVVAIVFVTTAGCASYRTSSNIESEPIPTVSSSTPVIITVGALPDRKHIEVGPVEVSVKKLTIFHKNPTKEQANEALVEKARTIGADAVINVIYKSGIGLTSYGYIDAKGTGVKFVE